MKAHLPLIISACAALLSSAAFAQLRPLEIGETHGTQPFHASYAGACVNKDDFSFSGTPLFNGTSGAFRLTCALEGEGTHGQFTSQALVETVATSPPPTCKLPDGSNGVQVAYKGVLHVWTFRETNDQLFLAYRSGTDCFSPVTGVHVGQGGVLSVIGGTGRFEGATGTIAITYTAITVGVSALGPSGFFSNLAGTLDGFITLK